MTHRHSVWVLCLFSFQLIVFVQCAHAAVGVVEHASRQDPDTLKQWRLHGQPKVVVKADNTAMLYVVPVFCSSWHSECSTLLARIPHGLIHSVPRETEKTIPNEFLSHLFFFFFFFFFFCSSGIPISPSAL